MAHELTYDYVPHVLVGIFVWSFVFKFIAPAFSKQISSAYSKLSFAKQIDWDSRVTSNVHSLASSAVCLFAIYYDRVLWDDPVWGDSWLVRSACSMMIGFFISDIIILLVYWRHVGDPVYIVHHLVSILAYGFVISYSSFCWFASWRMVAEVSTPFVNQRWFFEAVGCPKSSKRYMVNGIVMTIAFFVGRILTIPYYWYMVWLVYHTQDAHDSGYLWHVMVFVPLTLDVMNIFWMHKILKGATKVLKLSRSDKTKAG